MRITTVKNKNLQDLIIEGIIPGNLTLIGTLPDAYTIDLIRDGIRTIVVASQTVSGEMAYAIAKGDFTAKGNTRILNLGDKTFIKKNYPDLFKEIFPHE
jgi:hypothetical protein